MYIDPKVDIMPADNPTAMATQGRGNVDIVAPTATPPARMPLCT